MADQQIARLNQQITEYKNRMEIERRKHDEYSKKVREYFDEKQRLTQIASQSNSEQPIDAEKLRAEFSEDMKKLQKGYAYLEYERFKKEIGDITKPSDINDLLNISASFLIQFNEPMPRLIGQRDRVIDRCRRLENEIAAIQKDIQPISQQTEEEMKESRKQSLSIQNKINYLQIDRINKRLQHFSDRYKRETDISKIEGQIASSQTTYAYQKAALDGLRYVSLLLKEGKSFAPDQIEQIKKHTDNFNKLLKFKDKDQYDKKISKANKAAKKLNKTRKEATRKINEVLSAFSRMAQLEFSAINEINEINTNINMTELENYRVINEIKRLNALNNSLDSEIAEYQKDANEIIAENAKLNEEIQKSEEYRGKTLEDMNKIEKQLKEKQESKEKLLNEHKSLENKYQKSSDDFLKAISEIGNKTPEIQKSSEELTNKIKSIKSKINDTRIFEDIERPKNACILDQVKQDLEEIKKASDPTKIDNIQIVYNIQPNDMFSVTRFPPLQYYIVKTAHIKLAFDAIFYPYNVGILYPCTLITATLLGQIKSISLFTSSIINLINNSIKSNATNIDPNTKEKHTVEEMVEKFDKVHPYQFNKLIPFSNGKTITLKDVLIRSLGLLIKLIKIHPVNEATKNEIKNMLTSVDEKLTDQTEYSTTIKNLLKFNIDPKAAKKKRAATSKKNDEQNISNENSENVVDEKDRKQDVPIEKVGMSIKEKDLDRISFLDTKTISDNDFYNLFTYIQFNSYHKIVGADLILKYKPIEPQSPAYVEEMIILQANTTKFIKGQLQGQTAKSGKADDPLVCLKRWIKIAEIAFNNNNIFFFQAIAQSLFEYSNKDFDKIKTEFIKDKEASNKFNIILAYARDKNESTSKLSEIQKAYFDKASKSLNPNWFYIPSFNENFSSVDKLKELLSQSDLYEVVENKLQMKYIREIAEQLYFSLSGINSQITFKLNPDVVHGLEKRLAPTTEG